MGRKLKQTKQARARRARDRARRERAQVEDLLQRLDACVAQMDIPARVFHEREAIVVALLERGYSVRSVADRARMSKSTVHRLLPPVSHRGQMTMNEVLADLGPGPV
jgi:DNA-binding NarL/FixJ family response regulator